MILSAWECVDVMNDLEYVLCFSKYLFKFVDFVDLVADVLI